MGHTTAVRKLLFIDIAGGYLLSLGYEPFVRVWQPGNVKGDCNLGMLKGHNNSITGMCVLPGLPYVSTVDEKAIVNFWDIQSLKCLQKLVTRDECRDPINVGLIAINKNMIWTFDDTFDSLDNMKVVLNPQQR